MAFSGRTLLAVLVSCCIPGCHAGKMLSIAEPGSNLVLSCSQGQEINIHATRSSLVGSGEGLLGYCASVQDRDCLNPLFLNWSKFVCNNLQECRLPKPNVEMLVCNEDQSNTISALYRCENKFPDKQILIACDGQEANLKCEKGRIRIIKSNYGRLDTNTCTDKPSDMTFCTSPGFVPLVKKRCEGQIACSIPADPHKMPTAYNCDDSPKYVYVSYDCEE